MSTAEWPALAAQFRDFTFEQSSTYGRAAARRIGAEARFVALEREGVAVAAACIRLKRMPGLGRGIAWIAAGPLTLRGDAPAPPAEEMRTILAALRTHVTAEGHILRLRFPALARLDPETVAEHAAAAGFAPTARAPAYRTVAIDLSRDEETLMRGLHGKWRNPLRNAMKAGLELERGPIAALATRFHALFETVQAAKGFRPDIPPDFYYVLEGPDFDHEVLLARQEGVDVAGLTLGRAGANAVYLFGATIEPGRQLCAGHFLLWHAILRGRARGLAWLDLGGIDAGANASVARFKRRTGGVELAAAGPFETRPPGAVPALLGYAETLRARLKAGA